MSCRYPVQIPSPLHPNTTIFVPCGRCAWCKRDKRNEWCIRFEEEAKHNPYVTFLTLTYDNDSLPINETTGEAIPSVNKYDLQTFFKRARKDGKKFKYFAASEYGHENGRPHYHVLLFSKNGQSYKKYWFKGFSVEVPATKGSYRYVTKYILKGSKVPQGAEPNFMLCSKRPAIGYYLNEQNIKNQLKTNDDGTTAFTYTHEGGTKSPLPRYYRKKYRDLFDKSIIDNWSNTALEKMENTPRHGYLKEKYINTYGNDNGFEDWLNDTYEIDYKQQIKINKNERI